ncbi:MAG: hypothetical protein KC636_02395, partial [Myxococcales bacterium]|nr:hypothetical protein [Myxococcales bacterium]
MFVRSGLILAPLLAVAACKSDGNKPPLYTEASKTPERAPGEAVTEVAEEPPPSASERDLWFARGDGREAILARERGDHEAATQLLDRLLARDDLSADDRGAAELLRGLEDVEAGAHARAADRFAAARKAPALAKLDARLRLLEAQARLDAGDPARALELTEGLAGGPQEADLLLIRADASQRTNARAEAIALYEQLLASASSHPRRHEARAKLAGLLAQAGEGDAPLSPEARAELTKARALYETLELEVPLSDYAAEAAAALPRIDARLGARSKADALAFERSLAKSRIEDELKRGRYKAVIQDVDALLKG